MNPRSFPLSFISCTALRGRAAGTISLLLILGLVACNAETPAEAPPNTLEPGYINPGYHDKPVWFSNSFLDIREDVADAADTGKRLMLYFYQDGCPYCKKLLDTNFALREIETKTRSRFEVIAINMWGDREVTDLGGGLTTEKEFAKALRVMFTPTLLFLNEQGKVVLRIDGYYPPHKFSAALDYAAIDQPGVSDFGDFYHRLAPAPSSGTLHRDAAFLGANAALDARPGGKPLLVMFEQRDCTPCDELHLDILKRPASREQLQHFDIALLDIWSDEPLQRPDGKKTSVAEWARELEVQYAPSLVFFNAEGSEVFRTEAYLKAFHIQSVMDFVASGAYREQPSFQRFISARADALEAEGVHVDLME